MFTFQRFESGILERLETVAATRSDFRNWKSFWAPQKSPKRFWRHWRGIWDGTCSENCVEDSKKIEHRVWYDVKNWYSLLEVTFLDKNCYSWTSWGSVFGELDAVRSLIHPGLDVNHPIWAKIASKLENWFPPSLRRDFWIDWIWLYCFKHTWCYDLFECYKPVNRV